MNPRVHPESGLAKLERSIIEYGWTNPVLATRDGIILAGHGRVMAAQRLGMTDVPVLFLDMDGAKADAYMIADNRLVEESAWDMDMLRRVVEGLTDNEYDVSLTGFSLEELFKDPNDIAGKYKDATPGNLKKKFIMPPFSVLDSRQADWQNRKKSWYEILDKNAGRDSDLLGGGMEQLAEALGAKSLTGSSMFDPVLCEVLLHWFSPRGGAVLDPFAGGPERGIVSSFLDRHYYGVDLSAEQIAANNENFDRLTASTTFFGDIMQRPNWHIGDSAGIGDIIKRREFDMILSCPPYGNLEKYSDDPRDVSNMEYSEFIEAYTDIFGKAVNMLRENAFIVIVVGEIRDNKGYYRNFIGDTIKAIEKTGAKYYNEIILVTMIATAALRAGKVFEASRKVTHVHQKALVFLRSNNDDDALRDYISSFEKERILTPVKKSILIFIKGDERLAKNDLVRRKDFN